jgi:hypothetical protein
MDDPTDPSAPAWSASPTMKAKQAVQRHVNALLDALAPERALTRRDAAELRVETHRTPTRCVLQAANAAVSVSFFSESQSEGALGELHVVVWQGVVTRRGAGQAKDRATEVKEMVLFPIEEPPDERVWRATDGTEFDTASLAANCLALLEQQISVGGEKEL